jgi:hypothetical protein
VHGRLALEDSLIQRFFASAPPELRGEAVKYVGRSLRDAQAEPASEVLDRLMALWESRLAAAEGNEEPGVLAPEMEAFGWWFLSGKLPDEWALTNLIRALSVSRRVDLDKPVIDGVAALALDFPKEAITVAQIMISGDHQGWGVYAWREQLRGIVAAAHSSRDSAAQERARAVVNELVVRGYPDFREILS